MARAVTASAAGILQVVLVAAALWTGTQAGYKRRKFVKARCTLGFGTASGEITFKQDVNGGDTSISGYVRGLNKSALHGWHVHELAVDPEEGCASAGGHYNPLGSPHGTPENPVDERHAGDLGNLETDINGIVFVHTTDRLVSLVGELSVIGRGLVIHGGTDDLGTGGDEGSVASGNSGPRVACCTIKRIQTATKAKRIEVKSNGKKAAIKRGDR